MNIIPAINAGTFEEVSEKINRLKQKAEWVHFDIADGTFTKNTLWHNAEELENYIQKYGWPDYFEVHLMVENPERVVADWISAGAKRIIVHIETMQNLSLIQNPCNDAGVQLMLAIAPDTPVEKLDLYFQNISAFQVLSVSPGLPGQLFSEPSYDKIKYIRAHCPRCELEVDGGVRVGVARRCREAGANIFVAASAIFKAESIAKGIEDLNNDIS